MAFSDIERTQIEGTFQAYCERRIPPGVRDQIRLKYRIRGETVTLIERRPPWRGPGEWTASVVAQFRRDPATGQWRLYCADRNSRWHLYEEIQPARDLRVLLSEVDRDPTGIFWG